MDWKGCLLPLAMPLSVLVIGSWWLVVSNNAAPPSGFNSAQPVVAAKPDYSQPPPGLLPTCQQDSKLADALLLEGHRLGINVVSGKPELPGKDASYRALPGRLGTITIKDRPMSPEVRCMLISHEFIHVLQHLHGNLQGVPPLGWTKRHQDPSPQEAEAYGYQRHAGYVLRLLRATPLPN